jgi:hypothetical protein
MADMGTYMILGLAVWVLLSLVATVLFVLSLHGKTSDGRERRMHAGSLAHDW